MKAPHIHIVSRNPKTGQAQVVVHGVENGKLTSRTFHNVGPQLLAFLKHEYKVEEVIGG